MGFELLDQIQRIDSAVDRLYIMAVELKYERDSVGGIMVIVNNKNASCGFRCREIYGYSTPAFASRIFQPGAISR